MSAVIQVAQGLGSATFAVPTQPGNIIVVGIVNNDNTTAVGGFTDDASGGSNLYTNNPSSHAAGTNTQTDIWYGYVGAGGGTTPTAPCQTVIENVVGADSWMWIIELASNFRSLFLINPSDIFGNVTESGLGYPGASATPFLWADEGPVGGDVFVLAVLGCGGEGGTATGVEATWTTVGAVQGGNWLAYKFFANGVDFFPQPQFTASALTNYCMSMTAFYAPLPLPPTTGNIVIQKATVPSGSGQVFTFTPSYGASFTLIDGQSNNSGPLAPGTYSVVETPVPGWTTATSSNPAAIVVTAGVTTTVTFTNTAPGTIIVAKSTVPSGSSQAFNFTSSYGPPFMLTDGQTNNSGPLVAGTYSVAETPVTGWTTTVSQSPAAIVVTPGSSTTVTFTNTEQPGHIITSKVMVPPSSQRFTFNPSWGNVFTLGNGESNDSGPLSAGIYTISELPVDGWTTTASPNPANLTVADGQTTTVVFTNTSSISGPPPVCDTPISTLAENVLNRLEEKFNVS